MAKYRFRVLRGNHAEGKYPEGHPWAGRAIVYQGEIRRADGVLITPGEVIETDKNLSKFNSAGPLGPKFQRLFDATPATDKVAIALEMARRQEEAAEADDGNAPGRSPLMPQQAPLPPDGLDGMTIQELRKLAEEEGVQLPKGCSQEGAVRALRAASGAV